MSSPKPPVVAAPGGVRVALRVTPKASPAGVTGSAVDARGRGYIKLRVNAPAEDGKANAAALKLLAKEWGLARTTLRIIGGQRDRRKSVHVTGDTIELLKKLKRWIEDMNHD